MRHKKLRKNRDISKKIRSKRPAKNKRVAPRTTDQYFATSQRFQSLWDRVIGAISKMRSEKTSLQQASRDIGVSPRTVIRWGGSALRKRANGRYTAKSRDHLLRVLMIPTSDGPREIAVRGSRQATLLAAYWNAVHRYLETGDASRLENFQGKQIIDANGSKISLTTNLSELNRLGSAGVLSFESLYSRSV